MKRKSKSKEHEYLKYATFLTDEELMTMTDISPRQTGIRDVYIWVGSNPHTHDRRIKVSNVPNDFHGKDCFTMTIPDFTIIGEPNRKVVTTDIMKDIVKFVELNLQLIYDYSDEKMATDIFFDKIVKI